MVPQKTYSDTLNLPLVGIDDSLSSSLDYDRMKTDKNKQTPKNNNSMMTNVQIRNMQDALSKKKKAKLMRKVSTRDLQEMLQTMQRKVSSNVS